MKAEVTTQTEISVKDQASGPVESITKAVIDKTV